MVLDSSVLIAVVLKESEYHSFVQKANTANVLLVAAPTLLETGIVLSARLECDPRQLLTDLLRKLNAEIVDFGAIHYESAITAFLLFGKGRHPAALNFGDCMSYALAKVSGLPLLYSGTDFSKTDIQSA